MESNCDFIKEIDFYGKQPELYFKGKTKKVTWIGRIFTIIFIFIYIVFFVYKIYRIFQRIDITFYDTYSDKGEIPSINVTNENFNIAFTLIDGSSQEFILDETIYYPIALFKDDEMGKKEELELKPCSIDNIGSKYKKFFDESNLNKYYCLNKVNQTLRAYMNSFIFRIFPCKNSTKNNNHCKSKEIIDYYLNGNNFVIALEDILITPLNFKYPVKERTNELYTTLFKTFGQYLYIEMQLVNIETNNNIIGFDFLTKEKSQEYIKYDTLEIIPQPGYNLDDENNDYPVCEIEFQLKDKVLSEKRQYTQLFDVLGEVGGFMEIISSFFGAISSFIVDILYEKSIVNNLFSFDLDKKIISIKNNKKNLGLKDNNEKITNDNIPQFNQLTLPFNNNRKKKKIIFEDITSKGFNDKNSENILINKKSKTNIMETNSYYENYEKQSVKNKIKDYNMKESNLIINMKNKNKDIINEKENNHLINYIKINNYLVHLGFCFVRKRKNLDNVLLDEVMNIIKEKLDILNIFRDMCLYEIMQKKLGCEHEVIKMSDECIKILKELKIN